MRNLPPGGRGDGRPAPWELLPMGKLRISVSDTNMPQPCQLLVLLVGIQTQDAESYGWYLFRLFIYLKHVLTVVKVRSCLLQLTVKRRGFPRVGRSDSNNLKWEMFTVVYNLDLFCGNGNCSKIRLRLKGIFMN